MDPVSATLVLSSAQQALNAASGEAGRQAWQGFTTLARRVLGRADAVIEPGQAESLAGPVAEAARCDPAFAAELRDWLDLVSRLPGHDESVTNTISGTARNVVQARDNSGGITFN